MPATLIKHDYTPHGTQKLVWVAREKQVIVSGPAGTGKSKNILEYLNACAWAWPRTRILMVRKTRESLTNSGVVTLREKVIADEIEAGLITEFGGNKPSSYNYINGSIIVLGGMDKPEKVMSTEWDLIYVQEGIELAETEFEALSSRLRNYNMPYQQILVDTNPGPPTHWLKQRADKGLSRMINSKHEDNPTLFDPVTGEMTDRGVDYIGTLDSLTGVTFQRLRKGLWVAAEGLIYDEYEPDVHQVNWFPIPEDWPRFWVIDFGYTNPFNLQCWAEDPDGRLYMYREIYKTETLVEVHARTIMDIMKDEKGDWIEPKPQKIITDHDREDRKTFEKYTGLKTRPAIKEVTRGIETVKARLKVQPDGKRRIFFMRDSLVERDSKLENKKLPCSTVEEFAGYVWSETKTLKGEDMPVKQNDHGMDNVRYLVAYKDLRRRQRVA